MHDQYWGRLRHLPLDSSGEDLLFAIDQLRSVGRDIDVLGMLRRRIEDLPSSILLDLLAKGAGQVEAGLNQMGNMLSYYVELALKQPAKRAAGGRAGVL